MRLYQRTATTFNVKTGAVNLVLWGQDFGLGDLNRSLASLGIGTNEELHFLRRLRDIDVREGLRIQVSCAGTELVSGIYVCARAPPGVAGAGHGGLHFRREAPDFGAMSISWRAEGGGRPAAWHIEASHTLHGIYYLPSVSPTKLPLDDWEPYDSESRSQGAPMPRLLELPAVAG